MAIEVSSLKKFVAKLERRGGLPAEERQALLSLPTIMRRIAANREVVAEGGDATRCIMIESGLVSRTKTLLDGSRQIVAFGFPGDMIDMQTVLFLRADHGILTHMPTVVVSVAHADILKLVATHPVLQRALWLDTLVDGAIFRCWTANIGQRKAVSRMAHLLLELATRFDAIGELRDNTFWLCLTQTALSEALGLSVVHVNRSLQTLRTEGYIETKDRFVTIKRWDDMCEMAGFNEAQLHIYGPQANAALVKKRHGSDG